jgi:hypothetical protein
MKLKNTLRYLKGEELITHLGLNITISLCGAATLARVLVERDSPNRFEQRAAPECRSRTS